MEDERGLAAGDGAGDLPGVGVGDLEVQGEVVAGEVAGGDGASYVEGLLTAELAEDLGAAGDRLLQVEGVGGVEDTGDVAVPS